MCRRSKSEAVLSWPLSGLPFKTFINEAKLCIEVSIIKLFTLTTSNSGETNTSFDTFESDCFCYFKTNLVTWISDDLTTLLQPWVLITITQDWLPPTFNKHFDIFEFYCKAEIRKSYFCSNCQFKNKFFSWKLPLFYCTGQGIKTICVYFKFRGM